MSQLAPCPSCARHVKKFESVCPFCSAPLRIAGVPDRASPTQRLGRNAMFAFGAVVATSVAACSGTTTVGNDAGTTGNDAGRSVDAATAGDAGAGNDAGSATDAGTTVDAAASGQDAGSPDAGFFPPYGTPPIDGGPAPLYGGPPP